MKTPKKFHERFGIKIDSEEAKRRFVNRAFNIVLEDVSDDLIKEIAIAFGQKYDYGQDIDDIINEDFLNTVQALEVIYNALDGYERSEAEELIQKIIKESEFDLGIRWENGRFIPSGAKLLDEKLVNESLRWLSEKRYESVLNPFSKGLEHFLHA